MEKKFELKKVRVYSMGSGGKDFLECMETFEKLRNHIIDQEEIIQSLYSEHAIYQRKEKQNEKL
jgi:hypothetical protein